MSAFAPRPPLPEAALAQIFADAHTVNGFLDTPVPPGLLRRVYALARMGPTSMNCQPARFVMLATRTARERLGPHLMEGNRAKTLAAPVCVIVATDTRFFEHMPEVWHAPGARETFAADPGLAAATWVRNGTLGGAYFMLAARALGLDCGPMSGFNAAGVNAEFFPDGRWQANFLINLGYGDPASVFPRNPRLPFDTACRVF
ncbi:malonic semialdehyde reductase [Ottowia testudinis]|uniref:Malonic semialdehyde reductase n=1 Tax=Ottowia testudinis TaxID=2816950 RepID=A0A975H3Q0_9BURK|nr:malonic semialdehyde reductase [Ottowia testudinis]QTD46054.1 malonic semialdehyde reductase [Ottowia testudinis]